MESLENHNVYGMSLICILSAEYEIRVSEIAHIELPAEIYLRKHFENNVEFYKKLSLSKGYKNNYFLTTLFGKNKCKLIN